MAIIATNGTSSTDMTTNENASKPRPSSKALTMSGDQTLSMERQRPERVSFADASATGYSTKRQLERSGNLSRSLSRSVSTRNLVEATAGTSLAPQPNKRRKQHHSDQSFFSQGIGRLSPTLASRTPSSARASLLEISNVEEEKAPEDGDIALGITLKTTSARRLSSTNATGIHISVDEEYRSHEMQLPEACIIGSILTNDCSSIVTNDSIAKSEKNVDDYNYEVCTPLHLPPRLPTARESFVITERALEEKANWGWYA